MLLVPWAWAEFAIYGEGVCAGRGRVVVIEVVDELLDAYGILGREAAIAKKPPAVCVACGVDVDGESRQGIPLCFKKRIFVNPVVLLRRWLLAGNEVARHSFSLELPVGLIE
jgi:hypothetical protein